MSAWNTNGPRPEPFRASDFERQVEEQEPDDKVINDELLKYGRDLVEEARQGNQDPVIGRDDECRRVIRGVSEAMAGCQRPLCDGFAGIIGRGKGRGTV